jgi:acyl-CoA reductase-like NAD-dependent aldehyde dehydrogenase
MSRQELEDLLERVEDTREIVLAPTPGRLTGEELADELYFVWDAARHEANDAYAVWHAHPARDTYAVYRAAADRADAAADALARVAQ